MGGGAKSFQDLIVWRKAHRFALDVYRYTSTIPKTELYVLTSQFRRAAVSVPANIAEGFKERGKLDKARFLNIAQGSVEESRYYLILAQDLGYGDTTELKALLEEVGKMLRSYAEAILKS